MLIAVVNESTLVSDPDTQLMVRAVAHQLRYHAAPQWDKHYAAVVFYADKTQVPPMAATIAVLDDSDQAGALGWHDEAQGSAFFGRVFARPVLDNGGDSLTKPLSVASVLSHEVLELFVDPTCRGYEDMGNGAAVAREVGDPVESDSYTIKVDGIAVTVSNFVCPAWFDPKSSPDDRLDWMGTAPGPLKMTSGGYLIVMREGKVNQQFGERYPEWKHATKATTPLSRTFRRLGDGFS
jgi:hypothetical protein